MTVRSITMTNGTAGGGSNSYILQEALSAYSDEAYTNARKLTGTGIVGTNSNIDTNSETFIGQVRWLKPLNPAINVASLTVSDEGTKTTFASDYLRYIKTVRTHGASKVNMQQVITQQDGLAKIGRDFGETHAQDEHNAVLAVLKGVAISELLTGAANGCSAGVNAANQVITAGSAGFGGQTYDNDPTDPRYGFYVDLGPKLVTENGKDKSGTLNVAYRGASRAEGLLEALGKGFKDYEPEYLYAIVSPEVLASFRSANLVDETMVTEGNVTFSTLFQGKFRLVVSRATQSLAPTEYTKLEGGAGIDFSLAAETAYKTTFLVLPGALAMQQLAVPDEVEIFRNANTYKGGGSTDIWHRWGYVLAPAGYDWNGNQDAFPSDAEYQGVTNGTTPTTLLAAPAGLAGISGVWKRKATSSLALGILPVLHG
jgi:hypothetical protein